MVEMVLSLYWLGGEYKRFSNKFSYRMKSSFFLSACPVISSELRYFINISQTLLKDISNFYFKFYICTLYNIISLNICD